MLRWAFALLALVSSSVYAGQTAIPSQGNYVVQFFEAGIFDYNGEIKGLAATAPTKPNTPPEFESTAVKSYEAWLKGQRTYYLQKLAAELGHSVEPAHVYDVLQHAIALPLNKDEVEAVRKLSFVRSLWQPQRQVLSMHSTYEFVGADWIWDGTSTPNHVGTQGQGVTIAVIDTGGDDRHPFFRPMGSECGYSSPRPKIVLKNCNRSGCPVGNEPLASCFDSPDGLATDCVGHGTHVAGIAAGGAVSHSNGRLYQGIAKCAGIISYNAGDGNPFEPGLWPDAVMQAIEQAIRDRVQVVNMSFGPRTGAENPWGSIAGSDISPLLTLGLLRSGIVPVSASGNLGVSDRPQPVAGGVGHIAPWETVVAAATGGYATHLGWPGTSYPAYPDQIADFSLLGPPQMLNASHSAFETLHGVTKPDLIAPGINIESAQAGTNNFVPRSGTSMAAPVVAGAAALLKSANPTWTPSEIQSAMLLTAKNPGEIQNRMCGDSFCRAPWLWRQWTPDEGGSGRIALYDAGLAGFVMNETYDNFLRADPAHGGDPSTLNLPYVRGTCAPTCTWTRTLRATRGERINWHVSVDADPGIRITVSPDTFTLNSGGWIDANATITITATRTAATSGHTYYAKIWFDPEPGVISPYAVIPTEHLTVSVLDP